jgi:hypothetical protein
MISSIAKRVYRCSPDLFHRLRFRILEESTHTERLSSYVDLESGNVRARFVCDHGGYDLLEFQSTHFCRMWNNRPEWETFGVVDELIGAGWGAKYSRAERSEHLAVQAKFLEENFDAINKAFAQEQNSETTKRIKVISGRKSREQHAEASFKPMDEAEVKALLSLAQDVFSPEERQEVEQVAQSSGYPSSVRAFADIVRRANKMIPAAAVEKYADVAANMGFSMEDCDQLKNHAAKPAEYTLLEFAPQSRSDLEFERELRQKFCYREAGGRRGQKDTLRQK